MKLLWIIQDFSHKGEQLRINLETLILYAGQEFEAGYARIVNVNERPFLKIIENHGELRVGVAGREFPVTVLNENEHTQVGEQLFLPSDFLQIYTENTSGGVSVTSLILLPDSVPATIKI